jgi:hypothetical protein
VVPNVVAMSSYAVSALPPLAVRRIVAYSFVVAITVTGNGSVVHESVPLGPLVRVVGAVSSGALVPSYSCAPISGAVSYRTCVPSDFLKSQIGAPSARGMVFARVISGGVDS